MMARVSPTTLERPLYGFRQVDELLGLTDGTARRWIDGYSREKRVHSPVVRPEHTGKEAVTWGEFIETSLLAQYRDLNVPLQRLRPVVQYLRDRLGVRYPLAHYKPWVNQRDLVIKAQDIAGIEPALRFVAIVPRTGQIVLTHRAEAFFESVEWGVAPDGTADEAVSFALPGDVRVHAYRSCGAPSVAGLRTDIIAELVDAGESRSRVARVYNLTRELVDQAVEFERRSAA
jgi:uncharacterized protein (DUF433 family)